MDPDLGWERHGRLGSVDYVATVDKLDFHVTIGGPLPTRKGINGPQLKLIAAAVRATVEISVGIVIYHVATRVQQLKGLARVSFVRLRLRASHRDQANPQFLVGLRHNKRHAPHRRGEICVQRRRRTRCAPRV